MNIYRMTQLSLSKKQRDQHSINVGSINHSFHGKMKTAFHPSHLVIKIQILFKIINLYWLITIEDVVLTIFLNSNNVLTTNARLTICSRGSDNEPEPTVTVIAAGPK